MRSPFIFSPNGCSANDGPGWKQEPRNATIFSVWVVGTQATWAIFLCFPGPLAESSEVSHWTQWPVASPDYATMLTPVIVLLQVSSPLLHSFCQLHFQFNRVFYFTCVFMICKFCFIHSLLLYPLVVSRPPSSKLLILLSYLNYRPFFWTLLLCIPLYNYFYLSHFKLMMRPKWSFVIIPLQSLLIS